MKYGFGRFPLGLVVEMTYDMHLFYNSFILYAGFYMFRQ
jgi:hypothetical protein